MLCTEARSELVCEMDTASSSTTNGDELEEDAEELRELWRARAWNRFALVVTYIEAAGAFTVQLLYTVGLSKIFEEVLGPVSTNLDSFWSALLMTGWSFEEYMVFFVLFYAVILSLHSVLGGATYFCSKRVEQLLKLKLARTLLKEGEGGRHSSMDDLLELNKCILTLRRYVEEIKYEEFWSYSLISFGVVFTLVIAPELMGILAVFYIALYALIVASSRMLLQPKKDEIETLEQGPTNLLIDMVHMKDLILLQDRSTQEIDSLKEMLEAPTSLTKNTAVRITGTHIPRYLLAQLVIPVLIIYGFYVVTDASGLFQATIVILCTFQFAVAFNSLSLLEADLDEYKVAEARLRSVIDTRGLEFIFYKHDRKNGKATTVERSDASRADSSSTDSGEPEGEKTGIAVELDGVTVEYTFPNGSTLTVLHDMNLVLTYGQRTAVVGESGSGKSTLLKVMLGFIRPTAGSVIVNSQELRFGSKQLAAWRQQITLVSQDSLMFKRTLRENLCYGVGTVDEEDLQRALHLACLDEWTATLEDGLDTVLHGREKQLSGGQRQRIQLCRAFLQDKSIVFMDEPTASLDPLVKERIAANLDDFFQGKTVFCITHDTGMVAMFDKVYKLSTQTGLVLSNVEIAEQESDVELETIEKDDDAESVGSARSFVLSSLASIRNLFGQFRD